MASKCFILIVFVCSIVFVKSQTYCALRVPVPNRGYCDVSGTLEENIAADVYETNGGIKGVQAYNEDIFKLFDQQFTSIVRQYNKTETNVRQIEEELAALKDIFTTVQTIQAFDEVRTDDSSDSHRNKRAVTNPPSAHQQLLDAARLSFQGSIAAITQKLQGLSKQLVDELNKNAAMHSRMETDLATNQQTLTSTEQQLVAIETAIQQLAKTSSPGNGTGNGVSTSGVSNDVIQLLIHGATAEQVAERQLDNIDTLITQGEKVAAQDKADIQTIKTTLDNITKAMANDVQQISTLQGSEKFNENQVTNSLTAVNQDVASIRTDITKANRDVSKLAGQFIKTTVDHAKIKQDITNAKNAADAVQSLARFSKAEQIKQTTDILLLRKKAMDDINAMKYAFGLLTKLP